MPHCCLYAAPGSALEPMRVAFQMVGAERGIASWASPLLSASKPLLPAVAACWTIRYCTSPWKP